MDPRLAEIDELYRSIKNDYTNLPKELTHQMTDAELEEYSRKWIAANDIVRSGLDKFRELAHKLTPDKIIEGYQQGCSLLRANLSGHMYMNFDERYIPTLIQGIRDDDEGSYLFLGVLSTHLGEEFTPVVLNALESKHARTLDTALAYVEKFRMKEASPIVRTLSKSSNIQLAQQAAQVLESLSNGVP